MIKKHHNYFLFLIILISIVDKKAFSVDDSDILIDRVFMTAVKKKKYQKVEEMIDKDAAINYKDSDDLVALAYALANNDKKMFKLLISKGANPKIKILKDKSILIYYISINKYSLIDSIIESGVDIDFQDRVGMTALMHAIEKENVNAVSSLIEKKFNKAITDFSGKTIFDYSNDSRSLVIKKLIQRVNTTN